MKNFEIKNNDSLAPCGREKVYQSNLVNQSEGYLNIYSTPLTPALSRKGRGIQSGRSMIEMLGVLAIIGVLSVGGIAGYSKAMTKYRINKAIEQITLIAGNVRAFWGPQKNYIGVDCSSEYDDGTCAASGCDGQSVGDGCPIVKKAKIFPDEMITVTDGKIMSITNPFGGGVGLYTEDKAKSSDYQAFRIDYIIHNEEACIELTTHDWSNVGAGAIWVYGLTHAYEAYLRTPINIDKAVEVCLKALEEDSKPEGSDFIGLGLFFDIDINSSIWSGTFR